MEYYNLNDWIISGTGDRDKALHTLYGIIEDKDIRKEIRTLMNDSSKNITLSIISAYRDALIDPTWQDSIDIHLIDGDIRVPKIHLASTSEYLAYLVEKESDITIDIHRVTLLYALHQGNIQCKGGDLVTILYEAPQLLLHKNAYIQLENNTISCLSDLKINAKIIKKNIVSYIKNKAKSIQVKESRSKALLIDAYNLYTLFVEDSWLKEVYPSIWTFLREVYRIHERIFKYL